MVPIMVRQHGCGIKSIKEVFTQALWDEYLYEREKAMYEVAEKSRQVKEEEEAEEAKPPAAAITSKTKDGEINDLYKVETKKFPSYQQTSH
eukprot:3787498-Ditylum_brightwellii.AAC.1